MYLHLHFIYVNEIKYCFALISHCNCLRPEFEATGVYINAQKVGPKTSNILMAGTQINGEETNYASICSLQHLIQCILYTENIIFKSF